MIYTKPNQNDFKNLLHIHHNDHDQNQAGSLGPVTCRWMKRHDETNKWF